MLGRTNIAAALAAAVFTAATFMVPASAAHAEEATFTLERSELHTEEGLRNALKRLRMAARMQCRSELLVQTKAERTCREQVEAEWLAGIGSPLLTSLSRSTERKFAVAD